MHYLSEEKLVVVGAAGAIGSNICQQALTERLTPRITLYDINEGGLRGTARELCHCAFPNARITRTLHINEALDGADYIITSGGAPRRAGMNREDLLTDNARIAANLGTNIRQYCPKVKFVVVVFNPSDISGLTLLVQSGLKPQQVSSLAALDSTRLQYSLARHFRVPQECVTGCRVYGEHGDTMAVFHSGVCIAGKPLSSLIGTNALTADTWKKIQDDVRTAGKQIIEFRGRSSFQSPAHHAVQMLRAFITGESFDWPSGSYLHAPEAGFDHLFMTNDNTINARGVSSKVPTGTAGEMADLQASAQQLTGLRDLAIAAGHLPPLADWSKVNRHLA
ncbi:MAG: NAD-dependent epimerase/dehydratase family protein [Lentisphaeria bacterium]